MLATLPPAIVSLVLCFVQSCSVPPLPLERFAGTWTLNEAKSRPDEMQKCVFRAGANGGLEMVSGSQVTTIHLDGKPYDTPTPGVVQIWERKGPKQFYQTMREGKTKVLTAWVYKISDDGRTLTVKLNSGPSYSYSRTSGEGSGLAGTWDLQSWHDPKPPLTITIAGPDRLKIAGRVAVLDYKPVPYSPTAPTGATTAVAATLMSMMSTWKQTDDYTLVETVTRDGVPISTSTWTLSADRRVLTHRGGGLSFGPNGDVTGDASINVYDKQYY
jgi:hypothetical protein